jgi:drug/metabolite transporter (DMT)-like permease
VAVKKIGALSTSNYVYLNPVTTVVASALFLNEPMTLMAYAGSALILLGVYIANRNPVDD